MDYRYEQAADRDAQFAALRLAMETPPVQKAVP